MTSETLNRWLTLVANIGVLIGIALLIIEIDQNSELTSIQIHLERAEGKANRQMDLANNGEISRILGDLGASDRDFADLPPADLVRMQMYYAAVLEAQSNWYFLCQQEMLQDETCESTIEASLAGLLPGLFALNVDLRARTPSFISKAQETANRLGLTPPDDSGLWPSRPSSRSRLLPGSVRDGVSQANDQPEAVDVERSSGDGALETADKAEEVNDDG